MDYIKSNWTRKGNYNISLLIFEKETSAWVVLNCPETIMFWFIWCFLPSSVYLMIFGVHDSVRTHIQMSFSLVVDWSFSNNVKFLISLNRFRLKSIFLYMRIWEAQCCLTEHFHLTDNFICNPWILVCHYLYLWGYVYGE